MKNTQINKLATLKVAKALGDLCQEVVFVGGAMVSLYIDDTLAEDIRPTKDIDITFKITTASQLERIRILLKEKGFKEASDSGVICRFQFEDLLVDVMSTQEIGWAPSNKWFSKGFDQALTVVLDDLAIKVLPLPYFIATKLDAFFDRGIKDAYLSKDLEDLVYLINHTSDVVIQIANSKEDVRSYLKEAIFKLQNDSNIMSAIPGHLFHENKEENFEKVKQKLFEISQIG